MQNDSLLLDKTENSNESNLFNDKDREILTKLLENTSVNFLLGAGASYNYVDGLKSYPLMVDLLNDIKNNQDILNFYKLIQEKQNEENLYFEIYNIYKGELFSSSANVEEFLSKLEGLINLVGNTKINKELKKQREIIFKIIRKSIMEADEQTVIDVYKDFYNTLIKINKKSEKTSTKKFNIFTTNYDMLNEASMEALKLYYYSGFFGIYERKFNLSYYNYSYTDTLDLYGHKYYEKANYINLYKLHGSLSWTLNSNNELIEVDFRKNNDPVIIYPSMSKYNLTNLTVYYQQILREFSSQLQKPNSSLFVIGNSLGDEHLLKIIENSFDLENFNLVIFSYSEIQKGSIFEKLSQRENVYVLCGKHCTLKGFSQLYK